MREGGATDGKVIGVLAVQFDWGPQSQQVIDRVRLRPEEAGQTRCMILDRDHRVIASTGGVGVLREHIPLMTAGRSSGHYAEGGGLIGFALTPGYETYRGLGWYGAIRQPAALQPDLRKPGKGIIPASSPWPRSRHARARLGRRYGDRIPSSGKTPDPFAFPPGPAAPGH